MWADAEGATWRRYRHNAARHLMGLARDVEQRLIRTLAERHGHGDLRPSFGPLLSRIAFGDVPVGELALALATSRQACSQLVDHAERAGYVGRHATRGDGRTRLVRLTDAGRRLVDDGLAVLRELEDDYRQTLGPLAFEGFEQALPAAMRALDAGAAIRAPRDTRSAIGVLPELSLRIQSTLMRGTSARGHAGLKLSHAQVLPMIGPGGARVATLARIQGLSRQAISATARDLVALGYLQREDDPQDGRAVLFRLTADGARLLADSVLELDALDATLRDALGEQRADWLFEGAAGLYAALGLEAEVFQATASLDATSDGEVALRQLATRLVRSLQPEAAERLTTLIREELAAPALEARF